MRIEASGIPQTNYKEISTPSDSIEDEGNKDPVFALKKAFQKAETQLQGEKLEDDGEILKNFYSRFALYIQRLQEKYAKLREENLFDSAGMEKKDIAKSLEMEPALMIAEMLYKDGGRAFDPDGHYLFHFRDKQTLSILLKNSLERVVLGAEATLRKGGFTVEDIQPISNRFSTKGLGIVLRSLGVLEPEEGLSAVLQKYEKKRFNGEIIHEAKPPSPLDPHNFTVKIPTKIAGVSCEISRLQKETPEHRFELTEDGITLKFDNAFLIALAESQGSAAMAA